MWPAILKMPAARFGTSDGYCARSSEASFLKGEHLLRDRQKLHSSKVSTLQESKHLAADRHACKLGYEGIVSKRLGSPYRSGRSRDWIKSKNPVAPAVKREDA